MILKCDVCGKNFYIRPSDIKRGRRSCSHKCGNEKRIKITGENHHLWKGDNACYGAIHLYVRRYKPKPQNCEICSKKTDFLDLANISQEYKRDLSDWEYICRKCHMNKDGRAKNMRNVAVKGNIIRWENREKYSLSFPFNTI